MQQRTSKARKKKERQYKLNKFKRNKKLIISLIVAFVLVLGLSGFIAYESLRPMTFKDILGSDYASVEWNYASSSETAEDMKRYTLERAYPGSIDNTSRYECIFYGESGELVGSVTFLGSGNYLIHEGKVYSYEINKPTK